VAAGNRGFQILDVSQPERPVQLGTYGFFAENVRSARVEGTLGYLSTSSGLQIIDLSKLVQPIMRIEWKGGFPALELSGIVGASYVLEYAPSLSGAGNWTALSTFTLSNNSETLPDPSSATGSQRFYRLRLAP